MDEQVDGQPRTVTQPMRMAAINDVLFIAGLVAYWPLASAYSRRGTVRPILSSRDFRQASRVLQPKAFYF